MLCFRMSHYMLQFLGTLVYHNLVKPQDMVPVIHDLGLLVFSKPFADFLIASASEEASF